MCAESTVDRLVLSLERLGLEAESAEELTGDVSPRRYFRVALACGERCIVASYPPSLRDAQRRFAATTRLLETARVRVPRILANSSEDGVMAVEDFGGRSLFDSGDYPGDDALRRAVEIAQRIAGIDEASLGDLLPPLDGPALLGEIDQTWNVAFEPHGIGRRSALGKALDQCLREVCERLGTAEQRPCHRDFMARNLMRLSGDELGVLDHQDLRLGPVGYDVASLVSDSVVCPDEIVATVRTSAGLDRDHFDRLVTQRTFKIVGTFFAFAARGATRHLRLVPAAIDAGSAALLRLPEAKGLSGLESDLSESLSRLAAV